MCACVQENERERELERERKIVVCGGDGREMLVKERI